MQSNGRASTRWFGSASAAVALTFVFSCSGDVQQDYAVPESLCGIGVDPEQYRLLLPSGENLEVRDSITRDADGHTTGNGGCHVLVDGKSALDLGSLTSEEATDVSSFVDEHHYQLDVDQATDFEIGSYETRLWPRAVISFVPCVESERDNTGVALSILAVWSQEEDLSEALRQVIEPYVEARLAELAPEACTPP